MMTHFDTQISEFNRQNVQMFLKQLPSAKEVDILSARGCGNGHVSRILEMFNRIFEEGEKGQLIIFHWPDTWYKYGKEIDPTVKVDYVKELKAYLFANPKYWEAYCQGRILIVRNEELYPGYLTPQGQINAVQTNHDGLTKLDEKSKKNTECDAIKILRKTSSLITEGNNEENSNASSIHFSKHEGLVDEIASLPLISGADLVKFIRFTTNPKAKKILLVDSSGEVQREALKTQNTAVIAVNNHQVLYGRNTTEKKRQLGTGKFTFLMDKMDVAKTYMHKDSKFIPMSLDFRCKEYSELKPREIQIIEEYLKNPEKYSHNTLAKELFSKFSPSSYISGANNCEKTKLVIPVYLHSNEDILLLTKAFEQFKRTNPEEAKGIVIVFAPPRDKTNQDIKYPEFLHKALLSPNAAWITGAGYGTCVNSKDFGVGKFCLVPIDGHEEQKLNTENAVKSGICTHIVEGTSKEIRTEEFREFLVDVAKNNLYSPDDNQIRERIDFLNKQLKLPSKDEIFEEVLTSVRMNNYKKIDELQRSYEILQNPEQYVGLKYVSDRERQIAILNDKRVIKEMDSINRAILNFNIKIQPVLLKQEEFVEPKLIQEIKIEADNAYRSIVELERAYKFQPSKSILVQIDS